MKFVNVNLPCNKLSVRLLANNSITYTKIKRVVEIKDESDESSKVKAIQEKRISIKRIGKKSSKILVLISGLVGKPTSDIQALI